MFFESKKINYLKNKNEIHEEIKKYLFVFLDLEKRNFSIIQILNAYNKKNYIKDCFFVVIKVFSLMNQEFNQIKILQLDKITKEVIVKSRKGKEARSLKSAWQVTCELSLKETAKIIFNNKKYQKQLGKNSIVKNLLEKAVADLKKTKKPTKKKSKETIWTEIKRETEVKENPVKPKTFAFLFKKSSEKNAQKQQDAE